MIKRNFNVAICTLLVSILFGISAAAFALVSPWKYYGPIAGYSYRNQAEIYSTTDGAVGNSYVERSDVGNVPPGYMGVQARLYDSDGYLLDYTSFSYNINTCHGMWEVTDAYDVPGWYYYSKGYTKAYNGNGYNTYSTNRTPNMLLQ